MSMTTELIDRLKSMAAQEGAFDDKIKSRNAKTLLEAIDTIQLLSEKLHASQMERSSQYYHDGWIPVSERLPENDDNVLVYDDVDFFVAWYDRINRNWHSTDKNFDEYTPIIAWMPLPQPYQPKEDE